MLSVPGEGEPLVCVCVRQRHPVCLDFKYVCLGFHLRIKHDGNSDFNAALLKDARQDIAFVAVKSSRCIYSNSYLSSCPSYFFPPLEVHKK